MFRAKNITLLLLTWVVAICGAAAAFSNVCGDDWKDKEQVLKEVEKAGEAVENVEADLTYTKMIPLLEVNEVSKGEIRCKKPDKVYVKFAPPRNEINVVDGEYVWIFYPEARQVEKYRIRDETHPPQGVSFLELGYSCSVDEARKRYEISLIDKKEKNGKRLYVLELIPRTDQADDRYSKIHLWIEEGFWLPSVIELYESDGEIINKIELSDISLNRPIPDTLFRFTVPKGVAVVEPFK